MSPISKMTAMSGWSGLDPPKCEAHVPGPPGGRPKSWRRSWRPTAARTTCWCSGLARGGVPVGWEVAPRPAGPAGRVPGAQARRAAVAGARDGRDRHRRRRGDQRQPGAQPRHQRRAAAGRDRTRNRGTTPAGTGLPRRPAAGRHRRQDRDPGRRRHRHRRQHARRGACGAGRRPGRRWWSRCRSDRRRRAASSPTEADDVVCATMPPGFEAVGQVFEDFHQVTDDEVRELLAHANGLAAAVLVGGSSSACLDDPWSRLRLSPVRLDGSLTGGSSGYSSSNSATRLVLAASSALRRRRPGSVPAARRRSAAPRRSRWPRCTPRRSAHCW